MFRRVIVTSPRIFKASQPHLVDFKACSPSLLHRSFCQSSTSLKLFSKSTSSANIKTKPKPNTPTTATTPTATTATTTATTSSIDPTEKDFQSHPILKRVPKFLRSYAKQFINAPFSHLISFLILHEITAIIPLFSLWYFFHNNPSFIPMEIPSWAIDQGAKIIDYALSKITNWEINSKDKMLIIIEGAYAFSIVKFLLPLRIIVSLSLMPWFARWFIVPILNIFPNFTKLLNYKKIKQKQDKTRFDNAKIKHVEKPRL